MFAGIAWVALACSSLAAAESPYRDAVAVWHFADSGDASGKLAPLALRGDARVGVAIDAADHADQPVRMHVFLDRTTDC